MEVIVRWTGFEVIFDRCIIFLSKQGEQFSSHVWRINIFHFQQIGCHHIQNMA